jgi:hypothetical protein
MVGGESECVSLSKGGYDPYQSCNTTPGRFALHIIMAGTLASVHVVFMMIVGGGYNVSELNRMSGNRGRVFALCTAMDVPYLSRPTSPFHISLSSQPLTLT